MFSKSSSVHSVGAVGDKCKIAVISCSACVLSIFGEISSLIRSSFQSLRTRKGRELQGWILTLIPFFAHLNVVRASLEQKILEPLGDWPMLLLPLACLDVYYHGQGPGQLSLILGLGHPLK